MTEVTIRPLDLAEVVTLIGWAKAEGWNPGLADAAPFHAADPEGFIGCFVDGVMAAGISAVRYGNDFGFIGLYIAHPDFRGRGYARRVWDAGMAHLAGRTIGLDGVPEQQANYRSMGFLPDYDTYRWSGRIDGRSDADIRTLDDAMLSALVDFDSRYFPAKRERFLRPWLKSPRLAKVLVRGGSTAGYAVTRQCHEGCKIGPLFAETPADAMALLHTCAAEIAGQDIQIDVPAGQIEFSGLLAEHGFGRGFQTTRMYRGPAPPFALDGVFGVTTLELG
ncbi:GNAT family N-acetyltransferase [Aliirhizobium terrae]|uniref:GNAT family N-acetyltransferase n=1 Tax=Terrirhizobium terrae TaxID=2926709 RepID=UPI002574F6E9|nr:GNAT family N-acetyltransferase [Rhizobium sp. CC-CFT758]WJH42207.1 GNAT family N-acetyltransferase [Rhizobium sp. CC-CFT758]